jgi:uncharacterized protein (TIGR02246 family)
MKQVLIGVGIVVIVMSIVFAQTDNHAAAPGASKSLADVRRAIAEGNQKWSEGWEKGDAAMVAAIFADDGVQLSSGGKVFKGPQQISEHQKVEMQSVDPGVKVSVTTATVWLDGDTAYETGKYKYEYAEKGKPGVDEGQYVTIWKRQKDSSWKLSMDMGVPQK